MSQSQNKYRLQLPPDGGFTEWRSFDEKPTEDYCLSIEISNKTSPEDALKFLNENFKPPA